MTQGIKDKVIVITGAESCCRQRHGRLNLRISPKNKRRNEGDMKEMYFALPIVAPFLVRRGR